MKEEMSFDYAAWRAEQKMRKYKIVPKEGDAEIVMAHEPIVGDPTPNLRFVTYSLTEVDVVKEIGGSKNKTVETVKQQEAVADMVAAYHAGEWLYFIDLGSIPDAD